MTANEDDDLAAVRGLLQAGAVVVEMVNEPGCCELVLVLPGGEARVCCWPDQDHLAPIMPCVTARLR